jgi:hypothetical protein
VFGLGIEFYERVLLVRVTAHYIHLSPLSLSCFRQSLLDNSFNNGDFSAPMPRINRYPLTTDSPINQFVGQVICCWSSQARSCLVSCPTGFVTIFFYLTPPKDCGSPVLFSGKLLLAFASPVIINARTHYHIFLCHHSVGHYMTLLSLKHLRLFWSVRTPQDP